MWAVIWALTAIQTHEVSIAKSKKGTAQGSDSLGHNQRGAAHAPDVSELSRSVRCDE